MSEAENEAMRDLVLAMVSVSPCCGWDHDQDTYVCNVYKGHYKCRGCYSEYTMPAFLHPEEKTALHARAAELAGADAEHFSHLFLREAWMERLHGTPETV